MSGETGDRKYRVIVCEDEPLLLANLTKKIRKLARGFEVVGTAEDGNTAAEILSDSTADVLVTDIRMPGMDGQELIKLVSDRHPNMKMIVISGYGEFGYAQHAIRYGVVDYLLKPITDGQLEETFARVRSHLERKDTGVNERSSHINPDHYYSSRAVVSMVQDYIRNNYMREISVQTISDRFHLNASYLCRIFSKYVGEAPSKYLTSIRIDAAKSLLVKNPALLIRDAGELVGYPNQFHFSKIFKQTVGVSPESFRATHIGTPPGV